MTTVDNWIAAATGPAGFWRDSSSRNHFQTSTAFPECAEILIREIASLIPVSNCIDLGSGDGALAARLAELRPEWQVHAVDLREVRAPGVTSWVDVWDVRTGRWTTGAVDELWSTLTGPTVVIAHEFLDDLPCPVGPPQHAEHHDWCTQWWPHSEHPGIGFTRDVAWADVISRLTPRGGVAIAVDYGHVRATRPPSETLRGYRAGRACPVRWDGSVNITADVAMDAVAAAGERQGATTHRLTPQHRVVSEHTADLLAERSGLDHLLTRNHLTALGSTWGDWWWLVQSVPCGNLAR